MTLSRAWLHDTVSCAAWNDARKGVYLQKRTPGGPQFYHVSKNAVLSGVFKKCIWTKIRTKLWVEIHTIYLKNVTKHCKNEALVASLSLYLKPLFKTPCSNRCWSWNIPIMLLCWTTGTSPSRLTESVPLLWHPASTEQKGAAFSSPLHYLRPPLLALKFCWLCGGMSLPLDKLRHHIVGVMCYT